MEDERRIRRHTAALSTTLTVLMSLVALVTVRPWGAILPIVALMIAANAVNLWAAWKR